MVEEANYVAAVNAEANKVDDKNNDMVVTIEEEKKTLEYSETFNVYIDNISSRK